MEGTFDPHKYDWSEASSGLAYEAGERVYPQDAAYLPDYLVDADGRAVRDILSEDFGSE